MAKSKKRRPATASHKGHLNLVMNFSIIQNAIYLCIIKIRKLYILR